MIKLKSLLEDIEKTDYNPNDTYYFKKLSDEEKDELANLYFSIGHDGENGEEPDKHYCWIWDGNNVVYKKGGTHGNNFSHEIADKTFKGWFDTNKRIISVSFPLSELKKLEGRKPEESDIPQRIHSALIRTFGKRKPHFLVFENIKERI